MRQPWILMCRPDYYGIEYEINPWMSRSRGSVRERAHQQWQRLYEALGGLGVKVDLLGPASRRRAIGSVSSRYPGAVAISAFRALNVASDLTFVVPSPLQSATQTVIGQRLGAGDVEGARSFFSRARFLSFWLTTLTGAVCAALAWPLAFLFTLNAVVASAAALPLALLRQGRGRVWR